MLFNSLPFLFVFLPLVLVVTYGLGRRSQAAAKVALTLFSLGFYAWWRPIHLPLLVGSILFNYLVGDRIQRCHDAGRQRAANLWMAFGVTLDVALLGWFKYANFAVDSLDRVTGAHWGLGRIALPLAISFFTFQKIAYLVDSARGSGKRIGLLDFALFASFFPQLIAGPIVHFSEVVPQLQSRLFGRLIWRNMLVGLVIFSIGLFKKTVIADTMLPHVDSLFGAGLGNGYHYDLVTGWLAALTFTIQLYFDFSGYSDMAIGLGRMLGVKLPLNFHSPLRATGIIDYWRRWHMTLQRFILSYVFRPLSLPLNRWAAMRGLKGWPAFGVTIALPTFVTFLIIGIWHGAGWTFALFGAVHGIAICINEAWRTRRKLLKRNRRKAGLPDTEPRRPELLLYHALTLAFVMFANALFRAPRVREAIGIWKGMAGFNGLGDLTRLVAPDLLAPCAVALAIIFLLPNTQQIMGRFDPAYNWREWSSSALAPVRWQWRPDIRGLGFAAAALFLGIIFIQRGQAVFLYFNF